MYKTLFDEMFFPVAFVYFSELDGGELDGGEIVMARESRPPMLDAARLELYFAPLRKKRTSLMIEKAGRGVAMHF